LVGDMGGTSFEVSLIHRGVVSLTNEREVGGYRVATPGLRIHSIGAGGGSIAWAEEGKILRVGPASAGALPGPACYGKGGVAATVTDAQLVLGYLNPGAFLGGRFKLNPELAARAVAAAGEPLGLSAEETAVGIYRIVNANMVGAIRVVTIQEGIDPRDHLLVMGGGAGPIHAAEIAAELGIREVLIPRVGAVMCAYGMLMADFHHHFIRSLIRPLAKGVEAEIRRTLDELTKEAKNRSDAGELSLRPTLDVRYAGQFHEVEVPLADLDAKKITTAFHARHERLYGYADRTGEVELVNVHLYSTVRTKKPARIRIGKDRSVKKSFKETRKMFFAGKFAAAPVYEGATLGAGARLRGPCVVEYPDTAVVIQPYCRAQLDGSGNFRLTLDL
jgi:N-methylhydantoinase A